MPTKDHKLRVFLNYTRKDESTVRELYNFLLQVEWIDVWIDQERIDPGANWEFEIKRAMDTSDAAIICLSRKSVNKEGNVQKELKYILNILDGKPEGVIYAIPLRLDDCDVPRSLISIQYVDYFPVNEKIKAYKKLLNSLQRRASDQKEDPILRERVKRWKFDDGTLPKPRNQFLDFIKSKWGIAASGIFVLICMFLVVTRLIFPLLANSIPFVAGLLEPLMTTPTPTEGNPFTSPFDAATEQPPSQSDVISTDLPAEQSTAAATAVFQPGQSNNYPWNNFTTAQVTCMTPTIIPIQGANTVAFLPGGQLLAVDLGESDNEKIGILNIQTKTWDTFMDGKLLTQTPQGPMFVRGTDYVQDPNYILLAQNESLKLTLTDVVVIAFAVSPDGKTVAFSYESGQVEIKRLDTGKSNIMLGSSTSLIFSPDGSLLAGSSYDGDNYLWDVNSGALLQKLPKEANPVSFSPDGKEILYTNYTEIDAWNIETQQSRTILALQNGWVNGMAAAPFLSNDASLLVTGNTFWNVPEMTLLRSLNEHDTYNTAMITGSLEGDKLVSATTAEIIVWDLNCSQSNAEPIQKPANFEAITANNVDELKLAHSFEEDADFGSFSYTSNRFIMGGQVYSLADMNPISNFSEYIYGGAQAVAISPNGKYLTSEKDIGKLSIWDVDNDHWGNILDGCGGSPVFTPDGKLLAVNQEKKEICIWSDLSSDPQKIPLLEEVGGANRGGDIVVTASGIYQSTHLYDGKKFALFDIFSESTKPKYVLPEALEWVIFSPGGNFYVARNIDGTAELSASSMSSQTILKDFGYYIINRDFAFSFDDKLFAIMKYDDVNPAKIQIYNTSNWQIVVEINPMENMERFVFSPDGHYFVMSGAAKTYFWSVNGT